MAKVWFWRLTHPLRWRAAVRTHRELTREFHNKADWRRWRAMREK